MVLKWVDPSMFFSVSSNGKTFLNFAKIIILNKMATEREDLTRTVDFVQHATHGQWQLAQYWPGANVACALLSLMSWERWRWGVYPLFWLIPVLDHIERHRFLINETESQNSPFSVMTQHELVEMCPNMSQTQNPKVYPPF